MRSINECKHGAYEIAAKTICMSIYSGFFLYPLATSDIHENEPAEKPYLMDTNVLIVDTNNLFEIPSKMAIDRIVSEADSMNSQFVTCS